MKTTALTSEAPARAPRWLGLSVVVSAILVTTVAGAVGGLDVGLGALAGGSVSVANYYVLSWTMGRIIHGTTRSKVQASVIFGFKLVAIGFVVWVLLARLDVHAVGLLAGLSAIVIGVLVGGALVGTSRSSGGEG